MENNLGELYGALALARLEFGALTKNKTAKMGTYSYSYADLADVIEVTASAMAKQGLVIIQEPEVLTADGRTMVIIHGCIAHKSGAIHQMKPLPMPVAGNDPQKIGSAISYGRRYQLTAALNLAADVDDDGKEAGSDQGDVTFSRDGQGQTPPANRKLLSEAQRKRLHAVGVELYGEDDWEVQRPKLVEAVSKGAVKSSKELTPNEADTLISGIEKKIAQIAKAQAKTSMAEMNQQVVAH